MKKVLVVLALVATGLFSNAQSIDGATTIQTFPSTNQGDYKIMVMGNVQYLLTSFVVDQKLFKPSSVLGTTLEPGKFYMLQINDDKIVSIELIHNYIQGDMNLDGVVNELDDNKIRLDLNEYTELFKQIGNKPLSLLNFNPSVFSELYFNKTIFNKKA